MEDYLFPPKELLKPRVDTDNYMSFQQTKEMAEKLEGMFRSFGLPYEVSDHKFNNIAVVMKLTLKDEPGKPPVPFEKKVRSVVKLKPDIELCLGNPIEFHETYNSLEISVKSINRRSVALRDIMLSDKFKSSPSCLTVAAGTDISGGVFVFDLEKISNLLVVGVTGSGKSVFLNDILLSILAKATADQVRLILMDFKKVELNHYEGIPHLLYKHAITEPEEALVELDKMVEETERRIQLLKEASVRDISAYNRTASEHVPHIVILIDEFIELLEKAKDALPEEKAWDFWNQILKQLETISESSVWTGIHTVLATQSAKARDSDMKTTKEHDDKNFLLDSLRFIKPHASLVVVSKKESAELARKEDIKREKDDGPVRMLGEGDMLFSVGAEDPGVHIQTAMVTPEEVDRVVQYIRQANEEKGKE